ncbi:uncharacterized protein LOC129600318 [Paramacrobiotus metropolitanus]|uniref:uncharacterized protein LOC129600318 n=1 Tax=Paramacrobiotus metropolitanus TaxID=2943436 RepID=UPI0024461D0B|nr:uncharacterized protein LOC129600318 [Paramacrobiotus metropolitanus]
MSQPRKHVALLPYPLFGHITPLLQLARKISAHHDVTFMTSALRVQQLRHRGIFTAADEQHIRLVSLQDGVQESDDSEGTLGQMMELGEKTMTFTTSLFATMPAAVDPHPDVDYRHLVDQPLHRPVDVIIGDLVAFFQVELLTARGIRCFCFLSCSGLMLANKLDIGSDTPVIPDAAFFSDWEAHEDLNVTGIPKAYKDMADKYGGNFLKGFHHVAGYIVNSVEGLEEKVAKRFAEHSLTANRPVRFVAPLFAEAEGGAKNAAETAANSLVDQWLDKQKERDVVYVSFGSYAVSQKDQTLEIAKALMSLDKPFIWSLKANQQKLLSDDMKALIEQQSASSKYLVLAWTPQRRILNHPATRLFVSHVGYNSLLEAFDAGVPLVSWPMFGDQFANANMAQRLGNGLSLPATGMLFARVVPAAEVVEAVQKVGQWDKPYAEGDYTQKALEISRVVKAAARPGGSSYEAFSQLVSCDI